MNCSLSLEKHKKIGFKRPVPLSYHIDILNDKSEDEKEINDIESNSISSPEEIQPSSPVMSAIISQKSKSIHPFEIPINLENDKTIPEPESDLFECNFNWITENKFDFQHNSECDDFSQDDFMNLF